MKSFFHACVLISILVLNSAGANAVEPWNLPVLPRVHPSSQLGNHTPDKLIPRHLWIAVRDMEGGLNYQMPALFERNKNWEIHVVDNANKDIFMNKVWPKFWI